MKHAWADPVRHDTHTTYRGCMRAGCGMTRITRHEGAEHWTEYRSGEDDQPIKTFYGRAPVCEGP